MKKWLLILLASFSHAEKGSFSYEKIQKSLGIPSTIARVVESNLGTTGTPDFVLVQDIHRHPEVQGHIAAILLFGAHHWGLQDIYVEGARAEEALLSSTKISVADVRRGVQAGEIGGAEMAAILSNETPLRLHGLEDVELYTKHVEAYEATLRLQKSALRELSTSLVLQKSFDLDHENEHVERLTTLRKLLKLRLKPVEYASYREKRWPASPNSALGQAVRTAQTFYELADDRSRVFTEHLVKNAPGQTMAAVVGGFHTEWMAKELQAQGRTYVVLSPHVTQSGYDELYKRGMEQTISALKIR